MNLAKGAEQLVKDRKRWLQEAIDAQELLKELPEKLLTLETYSGVDKSYDGTYSLSFADLSATKILEPLGVVFFHKMFSGGDWYAKGRLDLESGKKVWVTCHKAEKPADCEVKEVKRTITEFVAICERTGKEI